MTLNVESLSNHERAVLVAAIARAVGGEEKTWLCALAETPSRNRSGQAELLLISSNTLSISESLLEWRKHLCKR